MEEQRAFGHYLRAERELRQIPLTEVARITKIPLHSLEMLEEGSWGDLPAEVFVRGFVISYARCVGMPADEAKQRFTEVVHIHDGEDPSVEVENDLEVQEGAPAGVTDVGGRRKFGLALLVIIVFIIATITLSLLWQRGAGAESHAGLPEQSPAVSAPMVDAPTVGPQLRG